MKKFFIVGGFWLIAGFLVFPSAASALDIGLGSLAGTGLGDEDLKTVIVNVLKIVLSFLTVVATIVILVAGFQWMTAGGSEEKITSAKKLLTGAIIGLAIVVASYAIVQFVSRELIKATGTT